MGAFEDFLKKQGYVKLDQYGLVLTPDDRILSTRPAVLDDGLGGKIVGWTDGDLAAAELDHWGQGRRKAPKAPVRPPAVPVARPAAPPVVSPLAMAPTIPQPVFATGTTSTRAPMVAAEPPVEEDEWEWEIAMARARAASDDVQEAAASITAGFTAPRKPAPKAASAAAAATKKAAATAAATTARMLEAKTDPMGSWPKTEELKAGWSDVTSESPMPQVLSPQHKALLVAKSSVPRSMPGATVIPVPSLPVAAKPSDVRPTAPTRTRIARGTGGEDTVQTLAAPAAPANDDHTSPYVTMPAEVKPTGYAGTRRVAAKHR